MSWGSCIIQCYLQTFPVDEMARSIFYLQGIQDELEIDDISHGTPNRKHPVYIQNSNHITNRMLLVHYRAHTVTKE